MVKKNQPARNQRRTVGKYNLRAISKSRATGKRRRVHTPSLESGTVPTDDQSFERIQLLENLRCIGIQAPSSCSTDVLRDLWA